MTIPIQTRPLPIAGKVFPLSFACSVAVATLPAGPTIQSVQGRPAHGQTMSTGGSGSKPALQFNRDSFESGALAYFYPTDASGGVNESGIPTRMCR